MHIAVGDDLLAYSDELSCGLFGVSGIIQRTDYETHLPEDVKENLKVFEVDHAVTQQVKNEKIKEIFGPLSDNVIYVPIFFAADRYDRKLLEIKSRHLPAFRRLVRRRRRNPTFQSGLNPTYLKPNFSFRH